MKKIKLIDENLGVFNHIFNNEKKQLKIFKTKIDNLYFNPLNTRVQDEVSTNFKDIFSNKNFDEVQKFIYEKLKDDHNDTINKLLSSKLEIGQTDPFVITEDGLIISGNNRYSIIKSNIEKGNKKIIDTYGYVNVAIVEGNLTNSEIISWELSTQREMDIKKDYDEMNLLMRVKELSEKGVDHKKIRNILSLPLENDVLKYINIADLYNRLLLFANVPNKKNLHRKIPVFGFLDGLNSTISKKTTILKEKKILPDIYFNVILGSTIPVQKFRDLMNKFVGNNKIEENKRLELLNAVNDAIESKLGLIVEKGRESNFDLEKNDSRLKYEDSEFREYFEFFSNEIKNKINFNKKLKEDSFESTLNKLNKNYKNLKDIDLISNTVIVYEYTKNEINTIKNELDLQIEILNKIKKEI